MALKFVPVSIAVIGSSEGRLVFFDDTLVAILVLLGDLHGDNTGKWFVETTFVEKMWRVDRFFNNLTEAEGWIMACLDSIDRDIDGTDVEKKSLS